MMRAWEPQVAGNQENRDYTAFTFIQAQRTHSGSGFDSEARVGQLQNVTVLKL